MNGSNGARIGRAEQRLDGFADPTDWLVRFIRWWNSVPRGDPAMAVYVAHIRAAAAHGRRRVANGDRPDPADVLASVAAFQAIMDGVTDEEFAARQTVEMQRLLESHERDGCLWPDCLVRAENYRIDTG
jgi:hypothetical protein